MENNIKDKSIAQLLQSIRTEGPNSDKTVKRLFFVLTGEEDAEGWTHQKCLDFYESILRHYNDNKDDLELLLAASGVSPGYRSIEAAIERREEYLAFLEKTDSDSKYRRKDPENTLRKTENRLLENVAKRLEDDLKCGNIPQLIKRWIPEPGKEEELSSDEPKPSPPPPGASSEKDPPPGDPEVHPPDPPPSPKGVRVHIGGISIGSLIKIDKKPQINVNLTWVKNPVTLIRVAIAVIITVIAVRVCFFLPQVSPESELPSENELPPVEEIFVTSEDVTLGPNERRELAAAVLPVEATGAALSYVSMDTSVVTVNGYNGMLQAQDSHTIGGVQPADIIIQAESGVTTTKTVFVDFSEAGYDAPVGDIDNFVPSFHIIQKIRLAGTTEWATSVNAEIGDIVEIQIKYENINEIKHDNVMIRDILPPNLEYISGTTKLYNVTYDGSLLSDGITTEGIKLGNYTPGSNAYVRFSAKVVDENLAPGSNTLVSWSQGGVGPVTLQDYAAVVVQK